MATHAEENLEVQEDLILENSPLDQYLKEIGMSEFNSYSSLDDGKIGYESSSNENVSPPTVSTTELDESPIAKSPVNWPFEDIRLTIMFFMNEYVLSNSLSNLRKPLGTILLLFSNSEILCDEENDHKCSTVVKYAKGGSSESSRTRRVSNKIEKNFVGRSFGNAAIHILIICISIGVLLWSLESKIVFVVSILVAVILLFVFAMVYRLLAQKKADKFSSHTVQLAKVFINNFETICKTFDKSFLVIRECEVISQGYTFYHPGLPAASSAPRKRGSCVTLRNSIMENSLKLFETIASIGKQLMKCLPKDICLIYDEDGIFNIDPNELKSSVSEIGLNRNGVPQTDLIRSMIVLIRSELIELFQITVFLIQSHLAGKEPCTGNLSDLENLLCTLHKVYSSANFSHILDDIDSKLLFTKQNEFKKNWSHNKPKLSLPSSPLQVNIDCAFLHLKAAVDHLECLESLVPNGLDSDGYLKIDEELSEKVNAMVNVFNHKVSSAKECVDDIKNSLSLNKDKICDNKNPVIGTTEALEEDLNVKLFDCDSANQQEGDVLLEGTSEPSWYLDELIKTEKSLLDERKSNEQLKESKRLVKELKAIFSFKKSPVGLVPLDLVKENMNVDRTVEEEIPNDVPTKQDVSVNEINTTESFYAAPQSEDESFLQERVDPNGCEVEPVVSIAGDPSNSILNDLKFALLNRKQQGLSKESTIEADTSAFDLDGMSVNNPDSD